MSSGGSDPGRKPQRGAPEARGIDAYLGRGGYEAARRVVEGLQPGDVLAAVAAAGLRDRLSGEEACGPAWARIRQLALREAGGGALLAIHAGIDEPGCFVDRWMLEFDPHRAIEGILIAAWAIGASAAYVYVRRELEGAARSLAARSWESGSLAALGAWRSRCTEAGRSRPLEERARSSTRWRDASAPALSLREAPSPSSAVPSLCTESRS